MKRRTQAETIDAQYGLEPVFEPGREPAGSLGDFVVVQCPYCGERYGIAIDTTAGSQVQIEDCQVCCQPIEFSCDVGEGGALESLVARRLD